MIDSSMDLSGGQDRTSSPVLTNAAVTQSHDSGYSSQESQSVQNPAPTPDRTYTKSELSDHIRRAKQEAIDTYRRQSVEQPEYVQQKYGERPVQATPATTAQALPQNDVQSWVRDAMRAERDAWNQESRQRAEQEQAKQIIGTFWQKVNAGKEKYSDFDQAVGDMQLGNFPNSLWLMSSVVENPADMLYEFGKNRAKIAALESLAERSPQDAAIEAKRMAQSIKDRQAAENMRVPNEPLNQIRHTNSGMSAGVKDANYYRNYYKQLKTK